MVLMTAGERRMFLTQKKTLFGIVLLAWSLTASGADTVRIAYIGMLSGPFALVGEDILKSFRGAADMVNAQGGALGNKQIEVVGFDGKGTPQDSVIALNQAIDQKFQFVTAAVSSVAHALSNTIAKHNERNPGQRVLFLDFQATDPALTESKCNFWHFRFAAHAGMELNVLTDYIARQSSVSRIYLINPDNPYGQAARSIAREMLAAKRPDIQIVGDDLIPLGKVKDFAPYVSKIRASAADSVLTGNWGNDLALFMKAGEETGLRVNYYALIAYLLGTPSVIAGSGSDRLKTITLGFNINDEKNPYRKYVADFKTRYKAMSNFDYAPAIRVVEMLAKAIDQAGTTDPLKVAYALEGMRYQGPGGETWMRADDHQLIAPIEIASLVKVGQAGVSYDVEGTGYGWKTEVRVEGKDTALPTTCRMDRP